MNITAFIKELLFGHDCVIIPGFGGFIGNYMPAYIDKSVGIFYPPVKQISFNRNLNHNDGLLVGKISEALSLNYGDARNFVEEYVRDLRKKLDKGEKVVFENIGSFVNNQEGNVLFEPDRNANYNLDSFGLESFQCQPIKGYDVRRKITRQGEIDPIRHAYRRKIIWRAAIVIPLLAILVIVPLKTDLFKSKVEVTTLNPLVTAEFEHNKSAVDDVVKNEAAKTDENIPLISEEPITPEVVIPVVSEANIYCLVTGSFKSEENAINQANDLRTEGFNPEIIAASNGFYRVSAMVCADMNTALSKKDSISKKYPGTWISRKQ